MAFRPALVTLAVASDLLFFACATAPRSGANGEAGPKGESRKDNQKKASPAHARSTWALNHPHASGAQAGGRSCPAGLIREVSRVQGARQIKINTGFHMPLRMQNSPHSQMNLWGDPKS